MFRHFALLAAILCFIISAAGCSGTKGHVKDLPPTMASIKPAKGLHKKIGVVLVQTPPGALGGDLGELFLKTLINALRDEDDRLQLFTSLDNSLPQFLAALSTPSAEPLNAGQLTRDGRSIGYQGLMLAAIRDVRPFTKKSGILWFRKVRYYISLSITLDLYDPLTAAKIVGAVEEMTIKTDIFEYEALTNQENVEIEALTETVVDIAEDLAELTAETLEDLPWQCSIIDIRDDRLIIPAGQRAGLGMDDRLAVFEGRRLMKGLQGEQFIVPGRRIAEVRVVNLNDQFAEASGQDAGQAQVGDIVVPIR